MSGKLKQLRIEEIRTDGGTQLRERIDQAVVEEYSRRIADLPSVIVYDDGKDKWLADGFHRIEAHLLVNAEFIDCEIHQGTLRDAILYSVGANANHGLRRSNADKRRAVEKLLADEEWVKWSDRKIADQCGVSHPFVSDVRASLTGNGCQLERSYTTKHGTTATMNVANIGARNAPEVTFGEIVADGDEPTALDDDNARPEPDEDEADRKAEREQFVKDAPGKALANALRTEAAETDPILSLIQEVYDLAHKPSLKVSFVALRNAVKQLRHLYLAKHRPSAGKDAA